MQTDLLQVIKFYNTHLLQHRSLLMLRIGLVLILGLSLSAAPRIGPRRLHLSACHKSARYYLRRCKFRPKLLYNRCSTCANKLLIPCAFMTEFIRSANASRARAMWDRGVWSRCLELKSSPSSIRSIAFALLLSSLDGGENDDEIGGI